MTHAATDPIANVPVCERNAAASAGREAGDGGAMLERTAAEAISARAATDSDCAKAFVRLPTDHDAEAERDEVVQRDGERAGQPVAAHAHGHAVEQQARQRIGRADDRPQQRHVGHAAAHEAGERNREDVEARRIRELIVARRDRGEIVAPAEHVLKAVRVEQRVADRHVRMQQDEQLEQERARR